MRIIYSGIDDYLCKALRGFPGGLDGKESVCNAGDPGLIPGLGRSLGEGNGYPLQCSCLGNSMDRGTCWAMVYGAAKRDTTEQLTNTHKTLSTIFSSVQFSSSVMADSMQRHESHHPRPLCPSPTPGVHPNSCASSR